MFAQHIPSHDLVALAWGETPSGVDASVAEVHLASCPQCAAELELARMSRRLEEEDNVALFPPLKRRPETATGSRRWRAAALAASLTGIIALSGWIYEFQQSSDLATQLARAQAPAKSPATAQPQAPAGETLTRLENQVKQLLSLQQENEKKAAEAQAQVAQLAKEREALARPQATDMVELRDVVRNGETAEATVPRDRSVILLLPAGGDGASGERQAEIVNRSGKVIWKASGLPVTEGFHSILLPAGSLEPGRYTLRISGREGSLTFKVVP
ncbi:MAG TPA: hypothetical protein VGG03_20405 [Thermoanaerobaculia bacterium]